MNLETRNTEPTKYADLMARARGLKSVEPSTLINAKALAKVASRFLYFSRRSSLWRSNRPKIIRRNASDAGGDRGA